MNYTTLVWDWNGTLLDDVGICIASMNRMLQKRGLPALDAARYREIFTFPVKDYYYQLGFDQAADPFSIIGLEFIDYFKQMLPDAPLQQGAASFLEEAGHNRLRQLVVSAMEQQSLTKNIFQLKIGHHFSQIFGIDNNYGGGKTELARRVADQLGNPSECLMIGDTLHDAEVALEVGWDCILIASGHQSANRLNKSGVPVFADLSEANQWFSSLLNRRN